MNCYKKINKNCTITFSSNEALLLGKSILQTEQTRDGFLKSTFSKTKSRMKKSDSTISTYSFREFHFIRSCNIFTTALFNFSLGIQFCTYEFLKPILSKTKPPMEKFNSTNSIHFYT